MKTLLMNKIEKDDEIFYLENYDRCDKALFYFGRCMNNIDTQFSIIFNGPIIHNKIFGPTEKFSKDMFHMLFKFLSIKYIILQNKIDYDDTMSTIPIHIRYCSYDYRRLYGIYEIYFKDNL